MPLATFHSQKLHLLDDKVTPKSRVSTDRSTQYINFLRACLYFCHSFFISLSMSPPIRHCRGPREMRDDRVENNTARQFCPVSRCRCKCHCEKSTLLKSVHFSQRRRSSRKIFLKKFFLVFRLEIFSAACHGVERCNNKSGKTYQTSQNDQRLSAGDS